MRFLLPAFRVGVLGLAMLRAAHALAQQPAPVQEPTVKYGKITPDAFQKNPYPPDSSAEGVVLYELGETHLDYTENKFWVVYSLHRRLHILKKSATDRATVSVRLYRAGSGATEDLSGLDGATYNVTAGAVVTDKLTKTGIVTERVSDNVSLQKFTLPNVREGSIIEYRYTIRTPFTISNNPRTWAFQDDIPTLWSEYRVTFPDSFYYKMLMNGYLAMTINQVKAVTVPLFTGEEPVTAQMYRFAVANSSAIRSEAYITTTNDYLTKIDFELASINFPGQVTRNFSVGWDAMDKTLLDEANFGGQYKRAAFLREVATLLKTNHPATDTMARIGAACRVIGTAMKWDETSSYYSTSIKKAYEAKKGDAADINLTLIALLREMGYDANPVVLSTRAHGRFSRESALLKQLNYVVAHLDMGGRDVLLDATEPYLRPGTLPLHALNGVGRLILPDSRSRFIALNPAERDVEATSAQYTIDQEGVITGILTQSFAGYAGYRTRKTYRSEGETAYLNGVKKEHTGWQIEKTAFSGIDDPNKSFVTAYTLTVGEGATVAGDRLYFRPLLTEGQLANPFKDPERRYPVDFGTLNDETYTATFTIPAGYQVEDVPKPMQIVLPGNGGRFLFQVAANGQTVQATSRLSLKKPVYFAEEYPALRELFAQVVAKHAEQVVLKRETAK